MLYRAKLKTGNKTEKDIRMQAEKGNWFGELTDDDITNIISCNNYLDGLTVIVCSEISGNGYTLISWEKESEPKIKEALYLAEQDRYIGTYINNRVGFEADWDKGEYEPSTSIGFDKEEVEILEKISQ